MQVEDGEGMSRYCSRCGSEKLCLYTTSGANLVLICNDCKADYGTVGILPETVDILNWMIDNRLKEVKE